MEKSEPKSTFFLGDRVATNLMVERILKIITSKHIQNVVKSRISLKISLHSMHFLVCCAPGFSLSKKNQPPLRLRHLPSLFRQGFSSCQTQTTRGAGDDHRLLGLQKGHTLGGFGPFFPGERMMNTLGMRSTADCGWILMKH